MILLFVVCILLSLSAAHAKARATTIPPACCHMVSVNYLPSNCNDFKICSNHTVSLNCDIGEICFPPNSTNAERVIMPLAQNLTREKINKKLPDCNYTPLFVRPNGTVRCASRYDDSKYILGAATQIDYVWVEPAKPQKPFMDFNWFLNTTLEYGRNKTVTHGLLAGITARNATRNDTAATTKTLLNVTLLTTPTPPSETPKPPTRTSVPTAVPTPSPPPTTNISGFSTTANSTDMNVTHVPSISNFTEPEDIVYTFHTANYTRELLVCCTD
ncbi:envelope protein UL128 [Cercopithecine betaherpesvirus 5]|uniref:Envelope protein UL128 n=1 Tax=Simian cytomegalovirus (strain Colburn) TaxID=50292 RepID=G8XTH9_SCMVC|nr:envelope protein UL128 [Cercopithecine betaherpesvirus 5]AEV80473.1 envelope protein UL128 [Cercopithecine betaherpesvirus 5]